MSTSSPALSVPALSKRPARWTIADLLPFGAGTTSVRPAPRAVHGSPHGPNREPLRSAGRLPVYRGSARAGARAPISSAVVTAPTGDAQGLAKIRLDAALAAGRLAGGLSRGLGRGSGTVVRGRVALAV